MVHSLGLHVVAERVEHDLQLQVLQSLKCNSIQGYYFSKPVPREQATALLANPSNIRRKVWAAESSDMSVKKTVLAGVLNYAPKRDSVA